MDFKLEVIAFIAIVMLVVLGPLLVFSPNLLRAKRAGQRAYGKLAGRYVEEFDQKWVRGGAPADEHLIVIVLMPVLPLALTMMPLEELITKFLGVIF